MRLAVFLSGLLSCAIVLQVAGAQDAGSKPRKDADQVPSYELVSIHKTKDVTTQQAFHDDPDGLTAAAVSLHFLIGEAYGFSLGHLSDDQLLGAPGWSKSQLFDILAKVDADDVAKVKKLTDAETMLVSAREFAARTPSFRMLMLQRLLEDRFRLKVHYEQRVMPLYEMTVAKSGVKMKAAHSADPEHGFMSMQNGKLKGENVPMGFIPVMFAMELQKPVEDKTSIEGDFDFEVHWTGMGDTETNNSDAPSIFTAVQEQLGLKLQPGKGPVWVIVVDHAEMPTEN